MLGIGSDNIIINDRGRVQNYIKLQIFAWQNIFISKNTPTIIRKLRRFFIYIYIYIWYDVLFISPGENVASRPGLYKTDCTSAEGEKPNECPVCDTKQSDGEAPVM